MNENEDKILVDLKKVPLASEREEKRTRRLKRFLIVLACLFFLVLGIFLGNLSSLSPAADIPGEKTLSGADDIEWLMEKTWLYADQYDDLKGTLEDKALYGMTNFDFDPYTSYMSAEELNSFSDSINRSYVGIGVEYSNTNDAALIVKVFRTSPAEEAGLKPGDRIIAVDGTSVKGLVNDEIRELVLGEEGTIVMITIERDNEVIDVPVVRGVIDSTVFAYTEEDYIVMELNSFGETTANEVAKYLDMYSDYHKIIIDLRYDGGGYQTSVRDISGLFIGPDEIYLRQKDANGLETVDKTLESSEKYDNIDKIVILTSSDTASAAEVLTIVLREKCDAIVVGETTYGKGVIQTNRMLSNGGALKLTTYYWYSPNGVSIDKVGIVPDYEVKMPDVFYAYYTDLEEDETYVYDMVDENVKVAQMALDYLDYDIERTDGYFDRSLEDALKLYQEKTGLEVNGILNRDTYGAIVSETRRELSSNTDKDAQLVKAKELMRD